MKETEDTTNGKISQGIFQDHWPPVMSRPKHTQPRAVTRLILGPQTMAGKPLGWQTQEAQEREVGRGRVDNRHPLPSSVCNKIET